MWCVIVCNIKNTAVLDGLLYKKISADTEEHQEPVDYSFCKQHKQIIGHNGIVKCRNMQVRL